MTNLSAVSPLSEAEAAARQTSPSGRAVEPENPKATHTQAELGWYLFEHLPTPTLIIDKSGHILHTNLAVEGHIPGCPRDQLAGRPFLDLIHPTARASVRQTWETFLTTSTPTSVETELENPDGEPIPIELTLTPLLTEGADAQPKQIAITLHDLQIHHYKKRVNRLIQERSALHEIATATQGVLSLQTAVEQGLRALVALFDLDTAAVYFVDKKGRLIPLTTHGSTDKYWQTLRQNPPHLEDTLAGRHALQKRSLIIQDLENFQGPIAPKIHAKGMRTLVSVPLLVMGRLIGILGLGAKQPNALNADDLPLLESLSTQLASSIEAARLHEQTEQRVQHLTTLTWVSAALNEARSLDDILHIVLDETLGLMNPRSDRHAGAVLLLEPEKLIPQSTHPDQYPVRLAASRGLSKSQSCISISGEMLQPGITELPPDATERLEILNGLDKPLTAVPLYTKEYPIGLILVAGQPAGEDARQLLSGLSDMAAVAIEKARLYQESRQRMAELTALQQVSLEMASSLEVQGVLEHIAESALSLVGADRAHIFLFDPQNANLIFQTRVGRDPQPARTILHGDAPLSKPNFEQVTALVYQSGEPLFIQDTANHSELESWNDEASSLAAFPLKRREQVLGAFILTFLAPHHFNHTEQRLLTLLSDQASVAVINARMFEELHRRLDEVTLLHQVAPTTAAPPDFDAIISRTVHAINEKLGFEYVGVLLLDKEAERLRPHPSFIGLQKEDLELELDIGRGITGKVAQTGKALRVPDVSLVTNFVNVIPGVQSALCVPLQVGERVIGVIHAESSQLDAFSADDERLLTTIASQLAITIENARLHQETQRRLREMTTLFNFAQHLSSNLQMDRLLETIVTSTREVLGCRGVSIALLDQESQMLQIKAAAGIKPKWREQARLRIGEGIMGQVAATGESLYVPDVHQMEDFIFFDSEFHSLLTVPLVTKDRVVGTLSIDHCQVDAFSADDERLVTIAAAQAAVAIENAQLFQDLQERATKLAEAYRELQEIDRLKDELVQNVSHELRTPVTFVRGYVDLLLNGDMGPLNEQQKQSLEIISQKTAAVTRLINHIMLLQQLEQSTLQLAPSDLVQVATEALREAQDIAERQGASLQLDSPPKVPLVLGDPERLQLVFQQMINNAIKFSPDGGQVQVKLEEKADHVQISIKDQGIGIPREQLERIFERFYQIDGSATRRFEGIGLGLTIAKQIIEGHGGKIWAQSRPGNGSIFYFTLPKSRSDRVRP